MNFNFVLANFHLARFYLGRFDLFYNLSIIKISLNGVGVDEGGDLYKNKSSISPNFYIATADIYDLPTLKHICEVRLAEGLNKENVVDVLLVADRYNAKGLVEAAIKYIVDKEKNKEIDIEELKGNPNLLVALSEALMKAQHS